MPYRPLSLAALTAGAFALSAATPNQHANVTSRYKIEQVSTQDIDATAAGGPKTSSTTKLTSFVSITLGDTTGGHTLKAVVDSINADSGSVLPKPMLDSLKGSVFNAFVGPNGRVTNVKSTTQNPAGAQVIGLLTELYPRTRPGMKTGDAWTDTTENANNLPNGSMNVRTVTNYKASGNEPHEGIKAAKIDAAFSSSMAGSQETPGGTANIEGTGSGTATYFVAPDGRYLGGTRSLTSALSVTGAFAPQPIPVNLKQTTTITPIK